MGAVSHFGTSSLAQGTERFRGLAQGYQHGVPTPGSCMLPPLSTDSSHASSGEHFKCLEQRAAGSHPGLSTPSFTPATPSPDLPHAWWGDGSLHLGSRGSLTSIPPAQVLLSQKSCTPPGFVDRRTGPGEQHPEQERASDKDSTSHPRPRPQREVRGRHLGTGSSWPVPGDRQPPAAPTGRSWSLGNP